MTPTCSERTRSECWGTGKHRRREGRGGATRRAHGAQRVRVARAARGLHAVAHSVAHAARAAESGASGVGLGRPLAQAAATAPCVTRAVAGCCAHGCTVAARARPAGRGGVVVVIHLASGAFLACLRQPESVQCRPLENNMARAPARGVGIKIVGHNRWVDGPRYCGPPSCRYRTAYRPCRCCCRSAPSARTPCRSSRTPCTRPRARSCRWGTSSTRRQPTVCTSSRALASAWRRTSCSCGSAVFSCPPTCARDNRGR